GCRSSPSRKSQPSAAAKAAPRVLLPLPDTPITTTKTGSATQRNLLLRGSEQRREMSRAAGVSGHQRLNRKKSTHAPVVVQHPERQRFEIGPSGLVQVMQVGQVLSQVAGPRELVVHRPADDPRLV